jgi:coproporphyrinogen III oxidase
MNSEVVENTVASLSNIADTHTKQINKVIDKNERLVQMPEAMVVSMVRLVHNPRPLRMHMNVRPRRESKVSMRRFFCFCSALQCSACCRDGKQFVDY